MKAKSLGRKILRDLCPIVTPDTLLRWHRQLVARKYDGSRGRRLGRPTVSEEIVELTVRMANENPSWGYTRIQGALSNLGHEVGRSTIARILGDHGIEPSPRRGMPWKTFLRAHWDVIAAADLFTIEVWRGHTLVRFHVLFAIELATRRVEILGIVPERSPNLNSIAKRFVRSIKGECLSRMIFFSERQLRSAVREYVEQDYPKIVRQIQYTPKTRFSTEMLRKCQLSVKPR